MIVKLQPKERVAVAFDVETMDAAMRIREKLGDSLGLAKVGSALFVREGMPLVRALQKSGISSQGNAYVTARSPGRRLRR